MTDELTIHIDQAHKREELPEMGRSVKCDRSDCPHPIFTSGYGLAGGGFGMYEYCEKCEKIVSKTETGE
jgi:hypothetical protein